MKLRKAALFGGALVSAGVANAANTFQFAQSPYSPEAYISFTRVSVQGSSGNGASIRSFSDNLADPESDIDFQIDNWASASSASFERLSVDVSAGFLDGSGAYASGRVYAYVQFTQDTDIEIAWSFADTPNFFESIEVWQVNEFDFDTVYNWQTSGDPLAGSRQFDLEAGVTYWISGFAAVEAVGQAATFSAIVVPAPGAAALAAVAGLAALRRRR